MQQSTAKRVIGDMTSVDSGCWIGILPPSDRGRSLAGGLMSDRRETVLKYDGCP